MNETASPAGIVEACRQYLLAHECKGERWDMPYHFYCPANTKYGKHQWLWDSGWHMITWSHLDVANAIADVRTMLRFQQPDGFIPEMIFWGERTRGERLLSKVAGYSNPRYTDITQMPMLAYSLRAIWEATGDVALLQEVVPRLAAYLDWWLATRDPDRDGLVSIIHGWESGIDASPIYDPAYGVKENDRGKFWKTYPKFLTLLYKYKNVAKWNVPRILEKQWFNVEDVGVCSVLAAGFGVLADLAGKAGNQALARHCKEQHATTSDAIIAKCWDDKSGRFVSFFHKHGVERASTSETIQTLFPLLLPSLPRDIAGRVVARLTDPAKFWLPCPVPSVARDDPAFNPDRSRLLWRGPSWPPTTWFVMEGLLLHGYKNIATEILDKWIETVVHHGIWEYYNPITGEGLGEEGLGMSTVIVDMMHRLGRIE